MKELLLLFSSLNFIKTHSNTNNDWGFGGTIKDIYTKDDVVVEICEDCYRHSHSWKYFRMYYKNGCIFTATRSTSSAKSLIKLINNHCV